MANLFPNHSPDMTISAVDFHYIQSLMRDRTAIVLTDDKAYLVESRLYPLAKTIGAQSIGELVQHLRLAPSSPLHQQVVEAMVTTETLFFRDGHPFTALQTDILPTLIQNRQTKRCLNIWCAACASGQEPYSINILIKEHFPQLQTWTVNILASDVSGHILNHARQGRYSQHEIERGMPPALIKKYFCPIPKNDGKTWELNDDVRHGVDFRQFNLAAPWPYLPMMDIVLLRNVLIYFDTETKRSILAGIRAQLQPDGYLLLGAGETTINLDMAFESIQMNQALYYRLR